MSYGISLKDPVTEEIIEVKDTHFMQGVNYAVGGTNELRLTVTYNYGRIFRRPEVLGEDGVRTIYGMTGAESIPVLQNAIANLGNDTSPDYWNPTDGNAKRALCQLLAMAQMRPDGIWDGD